MASNTENVKLGVCRVVFDGQDLGYTKGGVEVEVTTETHKVEVDQFGKSPINEYIMGRTITARVPLAETTLYNLVKIMPGAVLSAPGGVKATGKITLTGLPAANDTVTVNGVVFTFKVTATTATDVAIGGSAGATAANLASVLQAYSDPRVSDAQYVRSGTDVDITFDVFGTIGNAFTLAKSGTNITVSGATLSGGVDPSRMKVSVPHGIGIDLLSMARKLVLHPIDNPDSDKSEDLVIPLAMTPGAMSYAYKFDEERIFNVQFSGYPNPVTKELFIVGDETA